MDAAAAAAAVSVSAAAIERLQGMRLSSAWRERNAPAAGARLQRSADDGDYDDDAAAYDESDDLASAPVSQLAQLCCQLPAYAVGDESDGLPEDQRATWPTTSAALKPSSEWAADAEAAGQLERQLAAAYAGLLRGVCCSGCSGDTGQCAGRILDCGCSCHAAKPLPQPVALPSLDVVIAALENASEGTWLCNPRLLQQPHASCCCCSVCVGIVTTSAAGNKAAGGQQHDEPEALMQSISSGLDVLDVFGEWAVDDASLSYAVERRLITAFHKVRSWGCW